MSENPIEQLISHLNQVDLSKGGKNTVFYQNLLEKVCCENLKRYECKTHFLTPHLMTVLCDSLQSTSSIKIANAANLVAELGKYDCCRDFLCNQILVSLLLRHLQSSVLDVLIHTCRALGNICFEKSQSNFFWIHVFTTIYFELKLLFFIIFLGEAQNLLANQGVVKEICSLLDRCCLPNSVENTTKLKVNLVGFLLNLVADNEKIHNQVCSFKKKYFKLCFILSV